MSTSSPILTIDGPSGSGKGATSKLVAETLQWHLLDSGSIYRALAWLLNEQDKVDDYLSDELKLAHFIQSHCEHFTFSSSLVLYQQRDITAHLRTDEISLLTSQIAQLTSIRESVLALQRSFAKPPGLVADGRDMGSVVFLTAAFKVFLTARVEVRAMRRYEQLKLADSNVNYAEILTALKQRDRQDQERELAPLKVPDGAIVIDNSELSLDDVVQQIIRLIQSTT